jgi:hypothetical protein
MTPSKEQNIAVAQKGINEFIKGNTRPLGDLLRFDSAEIFSVPIKIGSYKIKKHEIHRIEYWQ